MTIANSVFAKASVAFVALAMAFSFVVPAQAQSYEDMSVDELIAVINQMLGGMNSGTPAMTSSACPYTWARDLNMGATGMDVMKLQQFLNSDSDTRVSASGAGSAGMETEYYGPATGAAVQKFQQKYRAEILTPLGLVNPTMYFGPATRAQANKLCVAAPMPSDDDDDDDANDDDDDDDRGGDLGNGEGDIDSVDETSSDESNVEEGQEGGVLGFEVEIDGDVLIDRMDFYMELVTSAGGASDNADDYFVGASLWMDGEKVGEVDVDDFRDDDYTGNVTDGATTDEEYRVRFSNLDLVFEDGDEPEFQFAVEVMNNVDSTDLTGDWTVALESIRYEDGEGFNGTESVSSVEDTFGFDEEETAELNVTEDDEDINDARTLEIDTDDTSEEYDVFSFEIEEENGVDVTINDIRVTITTLGSTTESDVVDEAILYFKGEQVASESVPNGGVVTFEDIEADIAGDETESFMVALVFKGSEDHGEGTTVSVAFTSITDADDANGNDEGDMTISGTAASDAHTLRSDGAMIEVGSDDTASIKDTNGDSAGGEEGVFVIKFDVTAFGDDLYLPLGAVATSALDVDDSIGYQIEDSNGALVTVGAGTGTTTAAVSTSAQTSGSYYIVEQGETESFTVTITFDPDSDGFYRAQLTGINFNIGAAGNADTQETATPAEDYETDFVDVDA